MATRTFDIAELTKEEIGGIYFRSLANVTTRRNHALLHGVAPQLIPKAIEADFSTWYGGFCSMATWLEPAGQLPNTQEMQSYVSQNIGRATAAIAA